MGTSKLMCPQPRPLEDMESIKIIVRHTMENSFTLGILATVLIVVPIVGIWAIHKYGWEHWEPFTRKHK